MATNPIKVRFHLLFAIRRCGCGRFLGVTLWRVQGPRTRWWCVTHGMCARCYAALEARCDAREAAS